LKREQEFQKIEKSFSEVKKISKGSTIDSQLQDELRILKEQTDRIDTFLNSGISIELSDAVKIQTADRKKDNLPPFRVPNNRSFNDGLIFFSVVEYLKNNSIAEYCFITKDRDFSDPMQKEQLDPSLIIDGLEIYFGPSLEKTIRILTAMGKIKDEKRAKGSERRFIIQVVRRNKMNFLDYLYEVLLIFYVLLRLHIEK
jgi:hypothetical protein